MSLTQDEEIPSESPLTQLAQQQPTNDTNSSQQDQPSQPEPQPQSQPEPEPAPEPEPPQEKINKPLPRLVLTQIELENFKSYYGRRIIGPFHKRFSSIVGPNGSGKSNVIDALLFVFGRRAKQIRFKKISELVHTSSNHRNCKQARVNIYFKEIIDNENSENEYISIPNSEIIISRIATKSNNSTYLIKRNNSKYKTVKFSKVREILLEKGIDLNNNRFLILQGEVESIAMMKPKSPNDDRHNAKSSDGLLEYLEDIIGSNKYIETIHKCGQQVSTLNNEVQERLNRVKIVERDRDKLSNAKNEAINYIKSQLQLYKLQGINKQIFINKYNMKHESLNENLVEYNNIINQKEEKQKEIQQQMKDIEDQYQSIIKQKKKIEKEVKKEENQFQELEQQDVSYAERLKYLKKETNKIKKNKKKLEKQKIEFTDKISENETNIPVLSEELSELQTSIEIEQKKQEEMMSDLTSKIQPIKEAMEEKQKQLIPLKDKENSVKQELDIINNNIDAIKNKSTDAINRKEDIINRINTITTDIQNKTTHLNNNIENNITTHNNNKNNINNNINRLKIEEKQLINDIGLCRKDLQNKRYLFENSSRNKHRIIGALMKAQEKGELSGILGRLGDLGKIDVEYDIAASTACTAALNYIVVEKTHHAQRVVEYLKRHNLGRATMLILEKQRHLQKYARKKIKTPNNVPRLYDLITFREERFNVAFYFAFRNTLVASNLNQANELAFSGGQRWRVVSLQGQLIETSGTITGGGNKVYKGLMSDRIIDESNGITLRDVQAKENELTRMDDRLSNIRKQIRELNSNLKQCNKLIGKLNVSKRKLNMEINGLEQRKQTLEEQLPELEANIGISDDDNRNLIQFAEEKKEKNEEFLSAQHDCEILEDEIRDLEEQILESGGNSLREQKKKLEKFKKKSKDKSKLLTKLKVEIKTLHKKLKNMETKLGTMEINVTEMKAEYDEIKIKKTELEEKAVSLMEILDEKKGILEEKDNEYKKLSKIVDKNNKQLTKLAKEIFEECEKRKTIETEVKQMQHLIKKNKSELMKLQNKYNKCKNEFLTDDDIDEESDHENENDKNDKNENDKNDKNNSMDVDGDSDDNNKDENKNENENENDENDDDDNGMEVDNDGGNGNESDNKNEDDEKAMEIEDIDDKDSKTNNMSLEEYMNENKLIFIILSLQLLEEVDPGIIDTEIEEIKSILDASQINMNAIEAYRIKDKQYVERLQDLQGCKLQRDQIREEYENYKKMRFDLFMNGFSIITKKLKEMYRMLTCGGDAELELVDSIDPFSEGVQFSVRPPKKSWKNISNLSGGEKTLSSMALVFALHHYKPTPLYVMDEIDAALDFKNVSIVANYIQKRTKNAQFVIISLRNNMFELANRLVGIYKTNNASKSITIDPKLFTLPKTQTQMQMQMQMQMQPSPIRQKQMQMQMQPSPIRQKQMQMQMQQPNININVNNSNRNVNNSNNNNIEDDEDDDILLNKNNNNNNNNNVNNENDMIDID